MTDPAPEKVRLFVAIDPPESVRVVLAELPRRIRGVVWTPPHQYHLTLRFIGEAAAAQLETITAALELVQVESFTLPVEGAGSFPPDRPARVLWVGIGSGHPRLFQLRQKIDDTLLGCGLDLDVKIFHPHFTLGRCGRDTPPTETARWLREHAAFQAPVFRADTFVLYRSDLRPAGAIHTPLLRVPLRSAS